MRILIFPTQNWAKKGVYTAKYGNSSQFLKWSWFDLRGCSIFMAWELAPKPHALFV